jgi:hypothetical protein
MFRTKRPVKSKIGKTGKGKEYPARKEKGCKE